MDEFRFPVHLRWADMDPNFHLRHDVYYTLGAQARVGWLFAIDLTPAKMQQAHFGPILFREECIFRREIRHTDTIVIELRLSRCRPDGSRWSMRHHFLRDDGTLCAELNVDGAWIDTQARKLTTPPAHLMEDFLGLPRTEDFEELVVKKQ
ncbi:MAG: thioesterase family protein [Flavobacteriales bacterium]|nr:thioesterase family protein [Flavobacteriales bacterium]MCB9167954.1 thioesterase family protein [Flavobacteriales bacterium]